MATNVAVSLFLYIICTLTRAKAMEGWEKEFMDSWHSVVSSQKSDMLSDYWIVIIISGRMVWCV